MQSISMQRSPNSKYQIWNCRAYLSILLDLSTLECRFEWRVDRFWSPQRHLSRLVSQTQIYPGTHFHSEFIILYFYISVQYIQIMEPFESQSHIDKHFPDEFFVKCSIFFLLGGNLLEKISTIDIFHHDTGQLKFYQNESASMKECL